MAPVGVATEGHDRIVFQGEQRVATAPGDPIGEDPPLLPAREIPSLVDGRGRFWASWKQFLPRAVAGRIDPGEVRAELRAQLELGRLVGSVRHSITRYRIVVQVREAAFVDNGKQLLESESLRWATLSEMRRLPVSTISRKALRLQQARDVVDARAHVGRETGRKAIHLRAADLIDLLPQVCRQSVFLLGGIVIIALTSLRLTGVMLGTLPFLIAAAVFFGRRLRRYSRETQDQLAATNTIVEETLQAIASVKAFDPPRLCPSAISIDAA